MSLEQVALAWSLLTIQGCRRLYETITLSKQTGSTMPLSHYLLAIAYYTATGIGVWIEGSGQLKHAQVKHTSSSLHFAEISPHVFWPFHLR